MTEPETVAVPVETLKTWRRLIGTGFPFKVRDEIDAFLPMPCQHEWLKLPDNAAKISRWTWQGVLRQGDHFRLRCGDCNEPMLVTWQPEPSP